MNSHQIEKILKRKINGFRGVVARNYLSRFPLLKENQSIVIWMCDYPEETNLICHFVCLIKIKGHLEYFDSFSNKIQKIVLNYVKRHKVKLVENKRQIQHEESFLCGLFCIIFLILIKKFKTNKFIDILFDLKNLKNNDEILIALFKNLNKEKIKI